MQETIEIVAVEKEKEIWMFPGQEFDADGVISKMMRGANWPRAGYLKNLHDHALLESIAKKCPNLHYVVSQLHAPCSEQEAAEALRAELQCGNTETRGALNQFLMTPSDIKEMWRANGEQLLQREHGCTCYANVCFMVEA